MSDIEWPGNEIDCTGENLRIHDYLCEILDRKGYSKQDVCIASVGMWGALKVMSDKLAVAKRDNEILELVNFGLREDIERHNKTIQDIDRDYQALKKQIHSAQESGK